MEREQEFVLRYSSASERARNRAPAMDLQSNRHHAGDRKVDFSDTAFRVVDWRYQTMYSLSDSNRSAIHNLAIVGYSAVQRKTVSAVFCPSRSPEWYLVASTVEGRSAVRPSGLA